MTLVEMHASRDQRDFRSPTSSEQDLAAVTGDGRRRRSRSATTSEMTLVGVPSAIGALAPARSQHDRDVVAIEAASFTQFVGGALGQLVGIRPPLSDRVPHRGCLDEGAQASKRESLSVSWGR